MQQERRLAAILFTDIVGYTAMMQQNEGQAVALVKRYLAVLHNTVETHAGQILNDYGDGSLCTFHSAVEAVQTALELQEKLKEEPAVPLRIGLHIGEIFFEDGKVFGDGVNVASRIQSLGQANTILFSGEINNKIRNRPEFSSASLGRFEFKNVDEPVEVFALSNPGLIVPKKEQMAGKLKDKRKKISAKKLIPLAAIVLLIIVAVFAYNIFYHPSKFTGKKKSIAVLPFANMSSDKENEYLSDGISLEITTQLTKIGSLDVRSWSSSAKFKNSNKSLKEIAEELNAAAILVIGSEKVGNKIRIHAELTDANTNERIWGDDYEREWGDIFAIRSELALQIAYRLNAEITKVEMKKIEKKPTDNLEAYKLYLLGRTWHDLFYGTNRPEYFENSISLFMQALKLDSNYALAHAALADLYNTKSKTDSQIVSLQIKEMNKAWEIDSTLEYVIFVRGTIEDSPLGNKENAFKYFKKGLESNPNDPDNLWGMAEFLNRNSGLLYDAKILFERFIKMDPLSAYNYRLLGEINYRLGNYDTAVKYHKTAIRLQPDFPAAKSNLAWVYATMGKLDSVKKMMAQYQLNPDLGWPGYVYAKLGNKKKALELAPHEWRTLLTLGMKEEAISEMLSWEEKNQSTLLNYYLLFKTKEFDAVRNDDRFLKIMERHREQYEENKKKFSIAGILN